MVDQTRTSGYRAVTKALRNPFNRQSKTLNLNWYSTLFIIPPEIATLRYIRSLSLQGSPVSDLSPIANLTAMERLNLDGTRVNDLAPLAHMTAMQDATAFSWRHGND